MAASLRIVLLLVVAMLAGTPAQAMPDDEPVVTGQRQQRRQVVTPEQRAAAEAENAARDHRVSITEAVGDTVYFAGADSGVKVRHDATLGAEKVFNPDPNRALWLSALCPGLGQIYNRRYWKLPIAFVGLGYGTSWNNRMLRDYSKAYRDLMDNDPTTRSYMDFYPPTTQESSIDKTWLQKSLKNKRSYYRRYRDICIIGMVGVYLLAIVDAYVDASLAHFDVSPDLSMRIAPTLIENRGGSSPLPSLGMGCAFTF